MPIRLATSADLESIARVLAAAFYDEELNAYFYPHRDKYPEDYVRSWYHTVLEKWWGHDNIWIVSYIAAKPVSDTSKDDGACIRDTVTGAAQWARIDSKPRESLGLYGLWHARHYFAAMVVLYLSTNRRIFPNRSIGRPTPNDPQPLRKWEFGRAIWPFCEHYYTYPPHKSDRWQLDILGVDPTQQKRGYGSELIAWGLRRARDEKLPAVVTMAKDLEDFYRKQGFEILVGYATTDDVIVEEKDSSGKMVTRTVVNPLKQRGIGGGGIAWTRTNADN